MPGWTFNEVPAFVNTRTLGAMIVNSFKEISIRGRLAYGATCLEHALAHHGIRHELVDSIVLSRIWTFTNSTDLGLWEESIKKIDPVCLFDDKRTSVLSDQENALKQLYESMPNFI